MTDTLTIPADSSVKGSAGCFATTTLLRIPLANITMDRALDLIIERTEREAPTQVSFVNADCVNITYRDPAYLAVLQQSEINLIDGAGMKLAGKWLGQRVVDNVNGTDLFPLLCARLAETGKSIFLLGARPGIGELVRQWIETNHRGVRIAGVQHGYYAANEEANVIDTIARANPDILLVAYGAPRQEKWIRQHINSLNAKVVMGVGGLFDFFSGRIPRAPLWMRRNGLEWCWRMYQEPRRLCRRYLLGNPAFIGRVLRERFFGQTPQGGINTQMRGDDSGDCLGSLGGKKEIKSYNSLFTL